ncbi:CheR family methyltransferase [Treponema zioleckii]|uniref:CheR family methyltransferase n=1 Tax=Treponema zioleckii TaxID=331680 RepID=UPI00168BF6D8|nr:CheR family methyltransferase [Treponema zioleckii]
METPANQSQPSINTVLKESLGSLQLQGLNETVANEKNDQMAAIDYKMVTFSLAGKDYAIDIMKVKEIAKAGRFTYVPNTLPFVLGVYNLRGEIIPIVDLRLFFNIDVPERKYDALENMLIVNIADQLFGVVVDDIDKVVGIQKSTINPPHPLFGDINIKYIQGVVEVNNRLYILLDIERIFGAKTEAKSVEAAAGTVKEVSGRMSVPVANAPVAEVAQTSAAKVSSPSKAAPAPEPKKEAKAVDYTFIVEGLASLRKFVVTSLNDAWIKDRYADWEAERGEGKTQLQSAADADAYLAPFYSPCTGTWWKKDYADALYKSLPDNTAKQIVVWNPGCGKGYETYSFACLLKKRYPSAKVRVYAHEIDLLSISNAPLLSVPNDVANDWYSPYVTKKANGEFTFNQEIRDSIMFEYHDCSNTNSLPPVDIILARDVLSFLPEKSQQSIVADFAEKLKGNGIVILGRNESLESDNKWSVNKSGSVTIFGKNK